MLEVALSLKSPAACARPAEGEDMQDRAERGGLGRSEERRMHDRAEKVEVRRADPVVCTIMHSPREAQIVADIAKTVRDERKAQNLRQDELAVAAGVSTRLVHVIESGKETTRLDGLIHVLTALGLSLSVSRPTPAARRLLPTDADPDEDDE